MPSQPSKQKTESTTKADNPNSLHSIKIKRKSGVLGSNSLRITSAPAAKRASLLKGHLEVSLSHKENLSNLIRSDRALLVANPPKEEFRKAVEENDREAQFVVGEYFLDQHDVTAACSWFSKAVESKNSKTKQASFSILKKLAENNPSAPAACYKLADLARRSFENESGSNKQHALNDTVKWLGATLSTESRTGQWIDLSSEEFRKLMAKNSVELRLLLETGSSEGYQNLKQALHALSKKSNPLPRQEIRHFLDKIILESKSLLACLRAVEIGQSIKTNIPHSEPWSNFKASLERKSPEFLKDFDQRLTDQSNPAVQQAALKQFLDLIAVAGLSDTGQYQSQAILSLRSMVLKSPELRARIIVRFRELVDDKAYSAKAWIALQGLLQSLTGAGGNSLNALYEILKEVKSILKENPQAASIKSKLSQQPNFTRDLLKAAAQLVQSVQGTKFTTLGNDIKGAASDIVKQQLVGLS